MLLKTNYCICPPKAKLEQDNLLFSLFTQQFQNLETNKWQPICSNDFKKPQIQRAKDPKQIGKATLAG